MLAEKLLCIIWPATSTDRNRSALTHAHELVRWTLPVKPRITSGQVIAAQRIASETQDQGGWREVNGRVCESVDMPVLGKHGSRRLNEWCEDRSPDK